MVARNPLWGGESGPNPDKTEVSQVEEPSPEQKTEKTEEEGEQDFWYLRGDDEGWSDPNPGQS